MPDGVDQRQRPEDAGVVERLGTRRRDDIARGAAPEHEADVRPSRSHVQCPHGLVVGPVDDELIDRSRGPSGVGSRWCLPPGNLGVRRLSGARDPGRGLADTLDDLCQREVLGRMREVAAVERRCHQRLLGQRPRHADVSHVLQSPAPLLGHGGGRPRTARRIEQDHRELVGDLYEARASTLTPGPPPHCRRPTGGFFHFCPLWLSCSIRRLRAPGLPAAFPRPIAPPGDSASVAIALPVPRSHTFRVQSSDPETARCRSGVTATYVTRCVWPAKRLQKCSALGA